MKPKLLDGIRKMPKRYSIPLALLIVASIAFATVNAMTGDEVIVGRRVPVDQRIPMDRIDHSSWDRLLQKYVNEQGEVDYRSWHDSREDVTALDEYLNELSRGDPNRRTSFAGHVSFWINAYNAVTIRGILREYPTTSIRNHTSRFGGYNIWHDLLLVVGDLRVPLDDMEHAILRKTDEPRIHFAIVCASQSCPRLLNRAYIPEELEEQLTENTRQFFANAANFRYQDETFYLSSILKWFSSDFGSDRRELLRYIAPYLPTEEARKVASSGSGRVSYLEYDWSLNEVRRR